MDAEYQKFTICEEVSCSMNKRLEIRWVDRTDETWSECERLEYDVFRHAGYLAENEKRRLSDFDEHQFMRFIAADWDGSIAGVVRIITQPSLEKMALDAFPTLEKAKVLPRSEIPYVDNETLWIYPEMHQFTMSLDPKECADIASMAVRPNRRNGVIGIGLISEVVRFFHESEGLRYGFAAIDHPFCEKMRHLGLPWINLGPTIEYWNSPTTPGICNFDKVGEYDEKQRRYLPPVRKT
jgi:hypothetical protein